MANNFKSLFMLDPEVTYFNHGAFGGCPGDIFNAMQEWQKTLEKNPSRYLEDLYDNLENSRYSLSILSISSISSLIFFAKSCCFNKASCNFNLVKGVLKS